jgi:putative Holliday junction resolvase
MNLLGLDIGERRIGVAVSRGSNIIASPLETLVYDDQEKVLARIAAIAAKEKAGTVVFGIPVDHAGQGAQEAKVRAFVDRLKALCPAEFVGVDESFTTRTAEKAMSEMRVKRKRRKELVDRLAAVLILQNYIDSRDAGGRKK